MHPAAHKSTNSLFTLRVFVHQEHFGSPECDGTGVGVHFKVVLLEYVVDLVLVDELGDVEVGYFEVHLVGLRPDQDVVRF